jgi:deoxyhypusine synthase
MSLFLDSIRDKVRLKHMAYKTENTHVAIVGAGIQSPADSLNISNPAGL